MRIKPDRHTRRQPTTLIRDHRGRTGEDTHTSEAHTNHHVLPQWTLLRLPRHRPGALCNLPTQAEINDPGAYMYGLLPEPGTSLVVDIEDIDDLVCAVDLVPHSVLAPASSPLSLEGYVLGRRLGGGRRQAARR